MNNINLVGRIVQELDLNKHNDKSYVKFTLAVSRYNDEVDFIDCIAWEQTAENLVKYMSKGSRIGVEGRLQIGSYESTQVINKETKNSVMIKTADVIAHQVHFLESKKEEEARTQTEEKPLPF